MRAVPNQIAYEVCPPGAPDKFRLTADAVFLWEGCPEWIFKIVTDHLASVDRGYIVGYREAERGRVVCARVPAGYYFAVSVAPNFRAARPAACLHDWIYEHSALLSEIWRVPSRVVLHIADRWFLANLRAADFLLARTYFVAVRVFGYGFHTLFGGKKRAA